MRRLFVLLVVATAVWLTVGAGAAAHHRSRATVTEVAARVAASRLPAATAPTAVPSLGTACFVGVGECSLTACTEFITASGQRVTPAGHCPAPGVVTPRMSPPRALRIRPRLVPLHLGDVFVRLQRELSARLAHR